MVLKSILWAMLQFFFIWHCNSILTNRCGAVFKNSVGNKKWARHSNVTLASGMQSQFDCHTNHVPICTFDNLWLCVLILDFGYDICLFISSSNSLKRRVEDGYYVQYKTDVIILQHSLGRLKTHQRRKLLFIALWLCIKSWFVIRYNVRLFLC